MVLRDIFLALFVIISWSFNYVILKGSTEFMSIEIFNLLRFAVFIPILFFIGRPDQSFYRIMVISFFLIFLNFLFMGFALSNGLSASFASMISVPRIIFAIFIAFIFLNEKISMKQTLGIILSSAVVFYLKYEYLAPNSGMALFYLLCAAFFWSFANIWVKKHDIHLSIKDIIWMNSVAAPFMLIYVFLQPTVYFEYSTQNLIILAITLLFSSLLATVIATYYWFKLIRKYSPIMIKPFMNLIPIFVLFEAHWVLGEPFELKYLLILIASIYSLCLCQNLSLKTLKRVFLQTVSRKSHTSGQK